MNVLYVSHNSGMGGANTALLNLIMETKKNGIVPYVLVPEEGSFTGILREEKIEYGTYSYCSGVVKKSFEHPKLLFHLRQLNNLRHQIPQIREIRRYVKQWNIDLIHSNSTYAFSGVLTGYLYHVPYVWHLRENIFDFFDSRFYQSRRMIRKLMKHSRCVICVSNYIRQAYGDYLQDCKAEVVYDGVRINEITSETEYQFDPDRIHILYAGGSEPRKGKAELETLVKALEKIPGREFSVWTSLSKAEGDQYLDGAKTIFEYYNPMKQAEFDAFRRHMTFFFQPSVAEAFGMVTAEAMMLRIPIVAVYGGCNDELIKPGETGYKYEMGDAEELRKQIMNMLENNEQRDRLIETANRFACRNCNVQSNADGVLKVYKEQTK